MTRRALALSLAALLSFASAATAAERGRKPLPQDRLLYAEPAPSPSPWENFSPKATRAPADPRDPLAASANGS